MTLVLAGALYDLRIKLVVEIDRPNPLITELGLPLDTEYADDVDFNDEEGENMKTLLPMATEIRKD